LDKDFHLAGLFSTTCFYRDYLSSSLILSPMPTLAILGADARSLWPLQPIVGGALKQQGQLVAKLPFHKTVDGVVD
jgi:hypothetical protein